jgi:hypothetical protein
MPPDSSVEMSFAFAPKNNGHYKPNKVLFHSAITLDTTVESAFGKHSLPEPDLSVTSVQAAKYAFISAFGTTDAQAVSEAFNLDWIIDGKTFNLRTPASAPGQTGMPTANPYFFKHLEMY